MSKVRTSLTYANVVSTLCLFIVLGGTSYAVAVGSIDSREIKNSTIRGKDVRNNSLTGRDVTRLGSGDIRDSSLLAKDFAAGQLPAGPRGQDATAPAGAVMFFNLASCPAGWSELAAAQGRYLVGVPGGGTLGGTSGTGGT